MNKQQAIDNIMDNFDFHKVWEMMQHNKHLWIHLKEDNCESVLRQHCRESMEKLTPRYGTIETGGFRYRYEVEDDKHYMSLEFVGEGWDNYW